jgi:hypothetical protein
LLPDYYCLLLRTEMAGATKGSAAAESLVEARLAEFGVGDDRTVEVRLAEVRLLVYVWPASPIRQRKLLDPARRQPMSYCFSRIAVLILDLSETGS